MTCCSLVSLFVFFGCFAVTAFGQGFDQLADQIAHGNIEQKRDALKLIRGLRTAEASRIAVPALHDDDEIVRATAAASVTFLPPTEAVAALLPLLRDRSPFVRKEAAYALGEVGDASATAALTALLEDKDMDMRAGAANALGLVGDAAALGALSALLRRPPSEKTEFVRRSAARSIGQIAEYVFTGRHTVVIPQNYLPKEFKKIAAVDAAQVSRSNDAGALLLRVFQNKSESEDTRREAGFALGALRYRPAQHALAANLTSDDRALAEICKEALLKLEAME